MTVRPLSSYLRVATANPPEETHHLIQQVTVVGAAPGFPLTAVTAVAGIQSGS